jgi:hypothetical protein
MLPDHDEQQWALGQGLRPGGRHHGDNALADLFERRVPQLQPEHAWLWGPAIREHRLRRVSCRVTMHYMAAVPISIRLPERTVGRLADRAERSNMPSRTLAQRYVEEGLRMDEHPLIRFADGPSGRRARLLGGPDVWEVIAVARDNDGDLAETASYLELSLGLVQAAASYYAAYPQEVDERIERNRREAHEAHSAFLAARDALSG